MFPIASFPLPLASTLAPRRTPLAAAVLVLLAQASMQCAMAQAMPDEVLPGTTLKTSPQLQPLAHREGGASLPIILLADEVHGRPDLDTTADGHVEMRRGGTVIRADHVSYDEGDDLAKANGNVHISRDGNTFSGPALEMHVERFQGYFTQPDYFIARTQAGGHAERVNFFDPQRSEAVNATYTSCPLDGSGDPAWLLTTDRVQMDFETGTGVAEGAVVRFYGVPILAAPKLSFPLTDDRKSGWLPPNLNIDSKSGVEVAIPYYWNIAPNRDATFTPEVMSRRGASLETEFRYLQPSFAGRIDYNVLPNDRLTGRERDALQFEHDGDTGDMHYGANLLRVSDDAYWKDFPRDLPTLSPRLMPLDFHIDRELKSLPGQWDAYARVERWQVLNDADPESAFIAPPYNRSPQLGLRGTGSFNGGVSGPQYSVETEVNRFDLADGTGDTAARPTSGARVHVLGALSWPITLPGGFITPRVSVNAASYQYSYNPTPYGPDVTGSGSRVIPTVSVDSGLVFERETNWFGRALRQTLEPRVFYLNTPYRNQSELPNFDSAGKDFNDVSVYSDNAFSGVDRVSDTNQLAVGVTTRWLDSDTGVEAMRLGLVERYLFRPQLITPNTQGGATVEGDPSTQKLSDVLAFGSSTILTNWTLNGAVQYDADSSRVVRSLMGVRYSPGPFRTIDVNYRLTRGSTEDVEVGWQWPIYENKRTSQSGTCGGSFYAVGRINYSMQDSRLTDSIVGMEYDAGCWIGRIVAERVSTGLTEATTRLMLQLELVGFSRLGSNPLKALKDNIPGYRLLRDERATPSANASYD